LQHFPGGGKCPLAMPAGTHAYTWTIHTEQLHNRPNGLHTSSQTNMILIPNSVLTKQIHCTDVALVYGATLKYNVTTLYNIDTRPREHGGCLPGVVCLSVC